MLDHRKHHKNRGDNAIRRSRLVTILVVTASFPATLGADTYAYDARGRLIGACQIASGNVRRSEYLLDSADNRSTYRNLTVVTVIPVNSSIWSADGRFQLAMQGDGNLVLYGPSGYLWASWTQGTGTNNVAIMQADGNLVIYNQQGGGPVWSSATSGHVCSKMTLQSDGNLAIYDLSGTLIWSTNTGGH